MISKSKMSTGRPIVVQVFGIWVGQSAFPLNRHLNRLMTHIHNACNMSLDRRTTEEQVDLVVVVSVAS